LNVISEVAREERGSGVKVKNVVISVTTFSSQSNGNYDMQETNLQELQMMLETITLQNTARSKQKMESWN
jgi:hypothetical protein